MSFARLRMVDISQGCDLKHSIFDTDALLFVRKGDDFAGVAVGDERDASGAGSVFVEKARQHVHGYVGRCAAKKFDAVENRNPPRDNGKTRIRIHVRLGYGEQPVSFWR